MVALGFLVIGLIFVGSLLKSIMSVLTTDWDTEKFTGMNVIKLFKIPFISFFCLIIFIAFIVPILQGNSIG